MEYPGTKLLDARLNIAEVLHDIPPFAESEGFEPSIRFWRIHTFQACAFDHSANSPYQS